MKGKLNTQHLLFLRHLSFCTGPSPSPITLLNQYAALSDENLDMEGEGTEDNQYTNKKDNSTEDKENSNHQDRGRAQLVHPWV